MSGDLEDFLRRAAQRRQAKAAQQHPDQPRPRRRPEYSDRHAERVVDAALVDEPLTAEIVEEEEDSLAARRKRLEESRRAAAEAQAEAAAAVKKAKTKHGRTPTPQRYSGDVGTDLVRALMTPAGVRQAILLREILERPEHRW